MKHRWPTSLHSQTEAIFHAVRSIREAKADSALGIRSFGSWKVYKYEAHRFVEFMIGNGRTSILDTASAHDDMAAYLEERLAHYVEKKRSRQTMETILSALGKFEYAINHYIEIHALKIPRLEAEKLRMDFYARSRTQLRKSSKLFDNRAYPDPVRLIAAISDGTFQLQASLQYEGGLRTEGVGAPSNRRLKNPLTSNGLRGISADPVTSSPVGVVASVEKGGKKTEHFVSVSTYQRLEEYISRHGKLESDYFAYVEAINAAAHQTGQYAPGRGSHGLKHNFAQERYLECIAHGLTHEQALQQTSLETSHFRLREILTYTRG
ncbi:hypothetical protein [Trichlorobacter lovleyi]|uniref:Core-binding (CB) domain-containing protein n=1 Tax=Trichlorobacter lovleyi (strain ATCC BAA-1151 / DSM 17278 / SZ) TaxID=398767 RepID=B3E515_TRIL1|nr:hypothetical protein [Trichlorobacter lovleyi]ACD94580.1 hypothetical protein Glov_0856 [Trichlorobacter lovleyi SZ]